MYIFNLPKFEGRTTQSPRKTAYGRWGGYERASKLLLGSKKITVRVNKRVGI
jgi:hypothetical protein